MLVDFKAPMNSEFMDKAISLAKIAGAAGEVPVGAVVVKDGKVIGEGRNRRETEQDALLHAETIAISEACKTIGSWRLDGCELYVTLEPCPMCAGAIINSRIKTVVFGAYDNKAGAVESVVNLFGYPFNHRPQVYGGIREQQCKELLSEFFKNLR